MRFLAVTMMILVACDDVPDDDVLIANFDMATDPSCTSCFPATTHTLDVTLRPIADASNFDVECTVEGDANVRVGKRGGALAEATDVEKTRLVTTLVSTQQYDFQCTGDGALTVTCIHQREDRAPFMRTSEEPITCLAPAGPPTAVLDVTGGTSAFALFSHSTQPAFGQALVAEAEQITNLAIGSCVKYVRTFPSVTLEDVGSVLIKNNGSLVATLVKNMQMRYEFGPIPVSVGTNLDVEIGGAGSVTASVGTDVIRPAPIAQFTNLTFVNDTLSSRTFTYAPVMADYLFLIFAYVTNTDAVTLWCRLDPAGGSFTMPQADFDAMSLSGTVRAETQNRSTFTLNGPNSTVMVNAHSSTMNGNFTKPTP